MDRVTSGPVVVAGIGIISPIGQGGAQTLRAILEGGSGIRPLGLFGPGRGQSPLPVGQVDGFEGDDRLPRTHHLALAAAREAMAGQREAPDAVVLGVTTGGMLTTESLLKAGGVDPVAYSGHSPDSVTALIARSFNCRGPILTVSTACSSGAVAIALATEMIRSGRAGRVLAGGADSLCRLTYHGFNALKIVDPEGARPFDRDRAGMSVGEGAAFLLLVSDPGMAAHALAEIRGIGLSCDAYHPAAPHPEGRGALEAMAAALGDAGLTPDQIDWVNLHGTGTRENDASEARALQRIFGRRLPLVSSVKGATGHGLAASGAIEAVISALAVSKGVIPGTTGCRCPDPGLGLRPLTHSLKQPVRAVLSNSLGFGGNNASLVVAAPEAFGPRREPGRPKVLRIVSVACITGAGGTQSTADCWDRGKSCRGITPTEGILKKLDKHALRRLRRLPRIALALAKAACEGCKRGRLPGAVFFGTGWGALSETEHFLKLLFESGEQFSSPTDFIGSVHNAAAGQVALHLGATGPNLTLTGGDVSFEQALAAAALLAPAVEGDLLVMGADEYHPVLSALFDPSAAADQEPADGGGAFWLTTDEQAPGPKIEPLFLGSVGGGNDSVAELIEALGGEAGVRQHVGAVLAGIPAAGRPAGSDRLGYFLDATRFVGPVIDYRQFTGEFAAASAVAAASAAPWATAGKIPGALCGGHPAALEGKGILLLGLGEPLTAVTIRSRG